MKLSLFGILNDPREELRPVSSPGPRPDKEDVGRPTQVWEVLSHDGKPCQVPSVVMKCIIVAPSLISDHIPEPRSTNVVFDQVINLATLSLED
jgi:hypothetical protein